MVQTLHETTDDRRYTERYLPRAIAVLLELVNELEARVATLEARPPTPRTLTDVRTRIRDQLSTQREP